MPKAYRLEPLRQNLMNFAVFRLVSVCALLFAPSFAHTSAAQAAGVLHAPRPPIELPVPPASPPPPVSDSVQRQFMLTSAKAAWNYVQREATSRGFIGATKSYQFLTIWDMASGLAAAYSARELGIITQEQYKNFVARELISMQKLPLYDNVAYNRLYSAKSGIMVDSKAERSKIGLGWSALDHGRMLVWLKLVANSDPEFARAAQTIVSRIDMSRMVKNGYMQGEEVGSKLPHKRRAYQEGRVGYEQYAAEGFGLWGVKVDSALDFSVNGRIAYVYAAPILADIRGGDVLTSEPFVMMGLELGWKTPLWRNFALQVLAAQEQRYKHEGIVTMMSEDAIPIAPTYFYYYLLYHNGKTFVPTTVAGTYSESFPRWVSAKAAFGYHALAPSAYTWTALQAVKYGGSPSGWAAGVYETTKKSTRTFNLNTAAIVLESAAYAQRGCPFIQRVCTKQ